MEVKYLGIKSFSFGKLEERPKKTREYKANRAAGCLNDSIWKNKYLTSEQKMNIQNYDKADNAVHRGNKGKYEKNQMLLAIIGK